MSTTNKKDYHKSIHSLLRLSALAFYTILIMFFGIFIFLLPNDRKRRANMILVQFWARMLCILFGIKVRTEGEPLPRQTGYLVTANHMSYFDIIILGSVIPGIFISKSEVRWWPLVGLAGAMVGTLYFKRDSKTDRSDLKHKAVERLRWGQNIFVFPEGTTSDGQKLLPFRYGAFDVAIRANASVLPVTLNYENPEIIQWTGNTNLFGHIFNIAKQGNVEVRLHIGPTLHPTNFKTAVDMSLHAWQVVHTAMIHFGMRAAARIAAIDWNEYRLSDKSSADEINKFMERLLTLLIQVDSSTPEGERQICQILLRILEINQLSGRILLSPEGRSNLIATKRASATATGDSENSYVVLLSNSDTVPADHDTWKHPPYSGTLEDRAIWGVGSIDMKGLLTVFFTAFLTNDNETPLHFLCTADQEQGGNEGAKFIADSFLAELNARVLLGEGGFGVADLLDVSNPMFLVDTAEKACLWLELSVELETISHSSAPSREYPLSILVDAVHEATELSSEVVTLPVTERFLHLVSEKSETVSRIIHRALKLPLIGKRIRLPFQDNAYLHAMFRNTVAVSKISAGSAKNVLAKKATAVLDCRLVPGVDIETFVSDLRRTIDDERVNIDIIHHSPANETTFDNQHFDDIRRAIQQEIKNAVVSPVLFPASTDLKYFRAHNIPCFGIFPAIFTQAQLKHIHGANEQIALDQLTMAYRVVKNFLGGLSAK